VSQLIGKPNFWEKTVHGLHHGQDQPGPVEASP
jgi:hypothetical protein